MNILNTEEILVKFRGDRVYVHSIDILEAIYEKYKEVVIERIDLVLKKNTSHNIIFTSTFPTQKNVIGQFDIYTSGQSCNRIYITPGVGEVTEKLLIDEKQKEKQLKIKLDAGSKSVVFLAKSDIVCFEEIFYGLKKLHNTYFGNRNKFFTVKVDILNKKKKGNYKVELWRQLGDFLYEYDVTKAGEKICTVWVARELL